MSVAVCRGPIVPAFEATSWLRPVVPPYKQPEVVVVVDDRPAQADIWNAIQADVNSKASADAKKATTKPYVHRSSGRLMSQKSLEVCTESLGNETGSGDFTSSLDMSCLFDSPLPAAMEEEPFWQQHHDADRDCEEEHWDDSKDLAAVNYHCSAGTTTRSPRRAFPPPLPSMSRRDGPCIRMRSHRHDGRLVVEAVAVRPRGYLNARRHGGRLRLSFVEFCARRDGQNAASNKMIATVCAPYFPAVEPKNNVQEEEEEDVEMEEEEDEVDEEEVEVVDRGTVVEVKVSTTPAAAKVHRSTLVINKFVGSTPVSVDQPRCHVDTAAAAAERDDDEPSPTLRRVPSSTTTLAAAVAVASTETDAAPAAEEEEEDECGGAHTSASGADEAKQPLLFTSRRGDKQDLLQSVRRCRQLRQKPLFILEQYCIATS